MRNARSNLILAVLSLVAAAMAATVVCAGTPGDAGFLSLRTSVGAREAAMGSAGVASAVGAAAIFWNPALQTFEAEGTDILLQHQRMWQLVDKETAVVSHRSGLGTVGFLFSGLYWDEQNRYDETGVGIPLGSFRPYEVALGASYARRLSENLAAGVMVKLLHSEIDVYGDTGLAYDFFLAHKAVVPGLWFGASLTNVGADLTYYQEATQLPTAARIGTAFDPQQDFFAGKITLAADVIFPNDGNEKAHLGLEYRLIPAFALRCGTRVNYESQGLTAGAGFMRGNVSVGYAFEEAKNDLGDWHRFALELSFGPSGS